MSDRCWKLSTLLAVVLVCIALALAAPVTWAGRDGPGSSSQNEADGDGEEDGEGEDEKEKDKKEEEKAKAAEPEIIFSPEGVSVYAVNVYAHRLFTRLAEQTDLQLVVDDAIKDRKVTINLTDKSPEEIVNYIVSACWQNAGRGAEWGTLDLPEDNWNLPQRTMGEILLRGVAELPTEFRARLEVLVSTRRAKVRAAPRIATISGRWASFFVGIQRYLRQPIEMGGGGDDEYYGGTRNYIDAGVRLGVHPWTGDGKEIICNISPEVSTLSALDPVTGLPEKITRTADTMVRVRDGQTIIIGGLRQEEERTIRTKVPLLGDLPLVGPLFQSTNTFTARTDLVIFITPRVLSRTGHLPAEEEQQLRERFLEAE